jgi:predicted nucleic acid-binding protein
MGVNRRRHDADLREIALSSLSRFPLQVDTETDRQAWDATLQLAEQHRLTTYDAAYLELALRHRLPLATLDRELGAAALSAGLGLLGG